MSGRFYSTADWQKIAARQLAREPICQGCDTEPATLVDHRLPISRGGAKRDPGNLQSLCRSCHAAKTKAESYGRKWIPPKYRGCSEDGSPRDPEHPAFRRASEPGEGAFDREIARRQTGGAAKF